MEITSGQAEEYSLVFAFVFVLITRCPSQLVHTSTNSVAVKLTTGQTLKWPQDLEYLASEKFEHPT